MNNISSLLLILTIIGILWLGSRFWEFSSEEYVNAQVVGKSAVYVDKIDLDFLKSEFTPAYEF